MRSDNILSDNFDPDVLDREYKEPSQPAPRKRNTTRQAAAKKESKPGAISRFIHDKRTRLFVGIAMICWAAYLIIVTLSYFTNGADDQSATINLSISEMAQRGDEINNAGGPIGAFLSQSAISNGIGIGALVIIYYFLALGWGLLHKGKVGFWSLTMKSLIVAITVSIVTGLVTYKAHSWVFWGGIHGYEVNTFLMSHIGVTGAILVSILLVALVASIYLNELRLLYVAYRKRVNEHRRRVEAERAAAEESRRKVEESLKESAEIVDNSRNEAPRESSVQLENKTLDFEDYANDNNVDDNPADTYRTEPEIDDDIYDTLDDETKDDIQDEPEATDNNEDVSMTVNEGEIEEADEIATDTYDPTAELSRYHFPSIELLNNIQVKANSVDQQEMEENKERITSTLSNYSIPISHIEATVGPTVTLYEIVPAEGVRIAKIKRLEDDIALSLAALGIRIIAPIPGKGTIGIEVPNKEPQMVPIRSIISSRKFQECNYELPMAMGSTISKDVFIADLTKMPHVLVAGATGQGKSVGLNTIIASLLYKKHPAELKFVLVDPKMVEFSLYSKLERHYLAKLPDENEAIITDPMKVVATLNSLCVEMDNRYALLKDANVRTIKEYNNKFIQRRLNPEKGHRYLPYIVIIVDEFGDLIMMAGKEVETPIARIAQKARAVGMHMILATQRPSTNVITGIIKANFPGRIAFRVSQMVDSRTILDRTGANQLIGKGDMLFSHNGEMERVQCAFISTEEVEAICDAIDEQVGYPNAYPLPDYVPESDGSTSFGTVNDRDPLFEEAARFIVTSSTASTSSLQRRYSIGYNRAGKIMDQLEAAGIVGPASGAKPRQVLVDSLQLERMLEITA